MSAPDEKPEAAPAKAVEPPSPMKQLGMNAAVAFGVVAIANVLFYFLSDRYFAERAAKHGPKELLGIDNARLAFAVFSATIGAAATAASFAPKHVGHAVGALAGIGAIIFSLFVFRAGLSPVLGTTLLVLGGGFFTVAKQSWGGNRAGWAFLVALCATLGIVMLFGAPTIGRLVGMSLWFAMIIPGVLAVATAALMHVSNNYRETARE